MKQSVQAVVLQCANCAMVYRVLPGAKRVKKCAICGDKRLVSLTSVPVYHGQA